MVISSFLTNDNFKIVLSGLVRDSASVLAKKEFEKQFENELKQYDDATIKEVIELYD